MYISGITTGTSIAILGGDNSPKNLTVTLQKSKLMGWKIVKVEGVEAEKGY
jgi:hypothetical protein